MHNYNKNVFASGKVIVIFRRGYTYLGVPLNYGLDIKKTEILCRISNSIDDRSGLVNEGGFIVLIHLNRTDKQAVINAIEVLRRNPNILYAEPDYLMEMDALPNDPFFATLWGLGRISAPSAWNIYTGSPAVVVGVLDSGIYYNHADLNGNMWRDYGWDFYNDKDDPIDYSGHGTHVAGTIGAIGNNGIGVTGTAWRVKMAALKIANISSVSVSAAIKAIVYATERKMPILNNSWGGRLYSESLRLTIEQYDGLFIASAGNAGVNNDIDPHYPASFNCENIVSVAATGQNDNLAFFSNYGASSVDIAAPGVDIYSTVPNGNYGYSSGTSKSAPYIAGAAALLKGYRPDLTTMDIKRIILDSADIVPNLIGKVSAGGRLNINAMLERVAL